MEKMLQKKICITIKKTYEIIKKGAEVVVEVLEFRVEDIGGVVVEVLEFRVDDIAGVLYWIGVLD